MCSRSMLFVVSAPSGTGKTSLLQNLLETVDALSLSISFTTRPQRPGEQDGVDYHFVSRQEFLRLREQGEFLECAEVFGHFYGTSKVALETLSRGGRDVLLEIDWQGARQIRAHWSDAVSLFLLPPDREQLRKRLRQRGRDPEQVIAKRLAGSIEEISHCNEFDYLLVNDNFDRTLAEMAAIVLAERARTYRRRTSLHGLIGSLSSGS